MTQASGTVRLAMKWLCDLLKYADPRTVAFWNGLYSAAWGLWLLLPFQTFTLSSTYQAMRAAAPEWVWGGAYLLVGALQVGSALWRKSRWCLWFSYVGVFQWLLLLTMYLMGDYRGLGNATYLVTTLSAAWVCIRLGTLDGNGEGSGG